MVPALAKRKKKPKKKNAPGVTPGVAGCPAPMGVPEQVATDPPVRVGCQGSHEDTMCINCGCAAHFRSECEAPPRCPTTLAYLGYGTERGSFYFVDVEIEEEVPRPHLASVTLAPEQVLPPGLVMSADLIQVELAAYNGDFRDSEFTWEVTETAPLIFSVPFPSAELLRVCSHEFIRCPINKFLISVCAATAELELVPPLEKVWVLVYGLPRGGSAAQRGGKHTHILKAISEPGRRLTFEIESPAAGDLHSPAPGASVPGDDGREGDGGSSEESSFCEEDDGNGRVPPAASDRRHTPGSTAAGPSSSAGVASRVASGIEPVIIVGPSPVITDLVVQDGVEALGGSSPVATTADDLEFTEADVLSVGMEVCPSSSPRSLGVARGEDSPVVSARHSARLSQLRLLLDGRVPTIQEKATLRAAARDLPPVPTDSGIVFWGEKGPILEQIYAICANEKLEGALAEARANVAHGDPSSEETTDPGHRETRGGATPSLETVAGTSRLAPSPPREPRAPHASQPHGALSREDISSHIYSFYKELFLAEPRGGSSPCEDFWPLADQVSDAENAELTLPFSSEEVGQAIASMKAWSAPGPDGLPVVFFQRFWEALRPIIMPMFHEFYIGTLDMGRIYYGVIALIPKVVGASEIRGIKDEIRVGLGFSMGNGSGTQFWLDPWLDGEPLHLRFPRLFAICADPAALVSMTAWEDRWHVAFRRSLGPAEVQDWEALKALVPLPDSSLHDSFSWSLSPSGDFSVSSAYLALCRCRSSRGYPHFGRHYCP
ncbi:Heparanase-like protein 2 [Hordeum vulgare]|nr:Heparanase-like protein 2 [Hordeum vulgare]